MPPGFPTKFRKPTYNERTVFGTQSRSLLSDPRAGVYTPLTTGLQTPRLKENIITSSRGTGEFRIAVSKARDEQLGAFCAIDYCAGRILYYSFILEGFSPKG